MDEDREIVRRLTWAFSDVGDATAKLLTLTARLSAEQPLWDQIDRHLSDAQRLLQEARKMVAEQEKKQSEESCFSSEQERKRNHDERTNGRDYQGIWV